MIPSRAPTARALRASDDERERVASVLRDHATDGRLSLDELSDRLDTCYSARTQGELESLMWDLPGQAPSPGPPAGRRPRGPGRTALVVLGVILAFTVLPHLLAVALGLAAGAAVLAVLGVALLAPLALLVACVYASVRAARARRPRLPS
jgi:hypothetical protein